MSETKQEQLYMRDGAFEKIQQLTVEDGLKYIKQQAETITKCPGVKTRDKQAALRITMMAEELLDERCLICGHTKRHQTGGICHDSLYAGSTFLGVCGHHCGEVAA